MLTKLTTAFAVGSFAVCTAIAGTLITAPKADANTCFNSSVTNGVICNTYQFSNRYGDVYTLGYAIGSTTESMTVVCNGAQVVDWKSNGTMSQRGAQRLANHFCSI
jgi:hypothetical protein